MIAPGVSVAARVLHLAELGDFAEAIVRGEEAVQIAGAANEPFSLIQAHLGIGGLHLRTGDFDRAIPALEQALDLCQVAQILDLPYIEDSNAVAAQVVSGSPGNFEFTVQIDRGSSSGVNVDMPVVTGAGLAGIRATL